jgi:hypothetical protein
VQEVNNQKYMIRQVASPFLGVASFLASPFSWYRLFLGIASFLASPFSYAY